MGKPPSLMQACQRIGFSHKPIMFSSPYLSLPVPTRKANTQLGGAGPRPRFSRAPPTLSKEQGCCGSVVQRPCASGLCLPLRRHSGPALLIVATSLRSGSASFTSQPAPLQEAPSSRRALPLCKRFSSILAAASLPIVCPQADPP